MYNCVSLQELLTDEWKTVVYDWFLQRVCIARIADNCNS